MVVLEWCSPRGESPVLRRLDITILSREDRVAIGMLGIRTHSDSHDGQKFCRGIVDWGSLHNVFYVQLRKKEKDIDSRS